MNSKVYAQNQINLFKLRNVRSGCPISRVKAAHVSNVRAFQVELEFRRVGFTLNSRSSFLKNICLNVRSHLAHVKLLILRILQPHHS